MSFTVTGLPIEEFSPLFGLDDDTLAEHGVIRTIADAQPGYPCRVTLKDAAPGDSVLLLHHTSHNCDTPYRSSYAIYVNETAQETRKIEDEIPEILKGRPIALRLFNKESLLIGAMLDQSGDPKDAIVKAFQAPETAYIHAHNAAHGCFAAQIDRA